MLPNSYYETITRTMLEEYGPQFMFAEFLIFFLVAIALIVLIRNQNKQNKYLEEIIYYLKYRDNK